MNLTLVDAFARLGAKLSNRQRALSALAADGALVINCSYTCFGHPAAGVLRYQDRLSRDAGSAKDIDLLGQHLTLARDGALPVRMVVSPAVNEQKRNRSFHVRSDLVGTVVKFDGDQFIIDFTRKQDGSPTSGVGPNNGIEKRRSSESRSSRSR
jgi:hypothetical protein